MRRIIYLKLLEKISEKNYSISEIAAHIHIGEAVLRKKLIGLAPLYVDEANLIADFLNISSYEDKIYFFS